MILKPGDTILVGDHDDYTKTTKILREHGIETEPHKEDAHVIVVTKVREDLEGVDNGSRS